jgi:hypothetical protein
VNGRGRSVLLLVLGVSSFGLASSAVGSATNHLPNPCRLLAMAHPETAFGQGRALTVSHRRASHEFSGVPTVMCGETVGGHMIWLSLSTARRGVVPIDRVRSQTQLSGLGPGATLTVYVSRSGKLVSRAIVFDRGVAPALAPTYASINVYAGTPLAALETLARRLYSVL